MSIAITQEAVRKNNRNGTACEFMSVSRRNWKIRASRENLEAKMTCQLWIVVVKKKRKEMPNLYPNVWKFFWPLSFHLYRVISLLPTTTKNAQSNLFKNFFCLPFLLWEMHSSSFTFSKSVLLHFYPFFYISLIIDNIC